MKKSSKTKDSSGKKLERKRWSGEAVAVKVPSSVIDCRDATTHILTRLVFSLLSLSHSLSLSLIFSRSLSHCMVSAYFWHVPYVSAVHKIVSHWKGRDISYRTSCNNDLLVLDQTSGNLLKSITFKQCVSMHCSPWTQMSLIARNGLLICSYLADSLMTRACAFFSRLAYIVFQLYPGLTFPM